MKRRLLFALAAFPFFNGLRAQTQISTIQIKGPITISQTRLIATPGTPNVFSLGGPLSGLIYLNGLLQSLTIDYTVASNNLTFIPAYSLTSTDIVTYVKFS